MPQFQFANVPGQFQQGQQFTATNQSNNLANQQRAENLSQSQFRGGQAKELDALRNNIRSAVELKAVPNDQKSAYLSNKIATGEAEGRDMTQSKQALELVNNGRFDELSQGTEQLLEVNERMGVIKPEAQQFSASQRDFTKNTEGLTDEQKKKAVLYQLGLAGRPTETITLAGDAGLTSDVAASQAEITAAKETAKEGAKLEQQLIHKPAITRAIALADAAAKEQGTVLNDLARAEAAMPGLIEATGNLRELAGVATSTYGGRFFDTIAKESGWGATEGGNARVKFSAIINNQVLPLLKQTFGGAMTEKEGEKLSASLGDVNATPEGKMMQLDAFIEQKMRDIQGLQLQADEGEKPEDAGQIMVDANGNRARVFADGTIEEL